MSRSGSRRAPALAVLLALAMALTPACGGDDDDTGTDDPAGEGAGGAVDGDETTTTEAATEETVTTLADGGGDTGDGGGDSGLAAGPNYESAGGPSGAGCTPGEVDTLPEGWWAGLILEAEGTTIQFDLLCFFTGDGAVAAAEEDGNTVENDYYVRNQNPRTFPVEFGTTDLDATCVDSSNATTYGCTVAEVIAQSGPGGEAVFPIVWLHVGGEGPDYLYTQYTP
jgi:hypothetical protein